MSKKEKKLIFISSLSAIVLIALAYFYQVGLVASSGETNGIEADKEIDKEKLEELVVGEPGSTHAHISLVVLIDGDLYNLSRDKYYEKSEYAHFHEGNGFIIHKHATGVSLPYFLETLGISFTGDCLILDNGADYCNEGDKRWLMTVNGNIVEEPSKYELRHGDKIMFDYSSDSITDVRVKAQSTVPDVPEDLMRDVFNVNN